jgi:MYXO-CTERM domain-containing protein
MRAGWVVLCALSAASAHAQGLGFRMLNDASNPFPYFIDGRSLEPVPNILLSQVQTSTDDAWATWQAVSCNADAFQSMGSSANNPNISDPADPYDAFSVSSVWLTDAGNPYWNFVLGRGIIGAAVPQAYGGVLTTCDIYLNGLDFVWTTNGTGPTNTHWVDLQSIVLHESGHCQGLGHTNDYGDVMYAGEALDYVKRQLSINDVQNICLQSPKVGAVGSACSAGPCAAGNVCVTPPVPDGGSAERICSTGCDPTSTITQCPAPFVCIPSNLIPPQAGACLDPSASFVTQVGKACAQDGDCGSAIGKCQQPVTLPSNTVVWVGGYCTQLCGSSYPPCPAASRCENYGNANICLQTCRPGSADCRPAYGCAPIDDGSEGVCLPGCRASADCTGGNYICRSCDGLCLAQQNPTAQLGDVCTVPASCAIGQVCLGFGTNPDAGICAQACGSTCTACPVGSSCRPVGANGVLYCLLDCPAGTCPNGLQCSETSAGPSCLPACGSDPDCPVGDHCISGKCVSPASGDGGCPLCRADSGNPPPPQDAGGHAGGNGGCGCQAAGAPVMLALLALALLGARRWRSR